MSKTTYKASLVLGALLFQVLMLIFVLDDPFSAYTTINAQSEPRITNISPLGKGSYWSPSWSPNGTQLAFLFDGGGNSSIYEFYIFDFAVSEARRLQVENMPSRWQGIFWQDEQTLVFVSAGRLYRLNITEGQPELIYEEAAAWSGFSFNANDTDSIFVSIHDDNPFVYSRSDIYRLTFADQSLQPFTQTENISEENPALSPDGEYLAYIAVEGKDMSNWIRGERAIEVTTTDHADPTVFRFPVIEGSNHLSWFSNEQIVFRAFYDGEITDDAGLFAFNPFQFDGLTKVVTSSDIREGISEFSISATTNQIAITTVGSPAGNSLVVVDLGALES